MRMSLAVLVFVCTFGCSRSFSLGVFDEGFTEGDSERVCCCVNYTACTFGPSSSECRDVNCQASEKLTVDIGVGSEVVLFAGSRFNGTFNLPTDCPHVFAYLQQYCVADSPGTRMAYLEEIEKDLVRSSEYNILGARDTPYISPECWPSQAYMQYIQKIVSERQNGYGYSYGWDSTPYLTPNLLTPKCQHEYKVYSNRQRFSELGRLPLLSGIPSCQKFGFGSDCRRAMNAVSPGGGVCSEFKVRWSKGTAMRIYGVCGSEMALEVAASVLVATSVVATVASGGASGGASASAQGDAVGATMSFLAFLNTAQFAKLICGMAGAGQVVRLFGNAIRLFSFQFNMHMYPLQPTFEAGPLANAFGASTTIEDEFLGSLIVFMILVSALYVIHGLSNAQSYFIRGACSKLKGAAGSEEVNEMGKQTDEKAGCNGMFTAFLSLLKAPLPDAIYTLSVIAYTGFAQSAVAVMAWSSYGRVKFLAQLWFVFFVLGFPAFVHWRLKNSKLRFDKYQWPDPTNILKSHAALKRHSEQVTALHIQAANKVAEDDSRFKEVFQSQRWPFGSKQAFLGKCEYMQHVSEEQAKSGGWADPDPDSSKSDIEQKQGHECLASFRAKKTFEQLKRYHAKLFDEFTFNEALPLLLLIQMVQGSFVGLGSPKLLTGVWARCATAQAVVVPLCKLASVFFVSRRHPWNDRKTNSDKMKGDVNCVVAVLFSATLASASLDIDDIKMRGALTAVSEFGDTAAFFLLVFGFFRDVVPHMSSSVRVVAALLCKKKAPPFLENEHRERVQRLVKQNAEEHRTSDGGDLRIIRVGVLLAFSLISES